MFTPSMCTNQLEWKYDLEENTHKSDFDAFLIISEL